jgi:glycosyltransferase involved in cell wall biosynthesis
MQNKDLISIIIPFYNIGNHVSKTIESLEAQIYRDFKVIFVNDASTDDSLEIVEKLLKNVSFEYKILNLLKNGGPSTARNKGLLEALGKYVYFLDSDDTISEDTLLKVMKNFRDDNSDLVFFKFKRVDINGNVIQHYNDIFKDVKKNEKSRDILKKYVNLEIFLFTCNVVYKKEIIEKVFFNENNDSHYYVEDQDFVIRALLNSHKVGYIDAELIQYVQRKGSIMNSEFDIKRLNKIKLFDTFFNQYRTKDEELSKFFLKRRTKEVLWVIKSYIKSSSDQNSKEIKEYIRVNILTEEILSYLEWEHLKLLKIKNIFQGFLLKYCPCLFIKIVKLI